jgi:monoamine oxidase
MASYSDGASVEFWAGLARHPDRFTPQPFACPPGVPITPFEEKYSASARLVDELQRQLRALHAANPIEPPSPDADILAPYAVVYRDWTQEPYGGGWHFWKIGVDSRMVMRFMRKPFNDSKSGIRPLYICGEAWSRQQGWVEGALETADDVLEAELKFEPLA